MQVCELHFDSFSLYFLQSLTLEEISALPAPDSSEAYSRMGRSWAPVLELTHNHGTESDPSFSYHNGNTEPQVCTSVRARVYVARQSNRSGGQNLEFRRIKGMQNLVIGCEYSVHQQRFLRAATSVHLYSRCEPFLASRCPVPHLSGLRVPWLHC